MQPPGVYRVSQVEQLTNVGAHTLRAWERRYGVPRPPRSEGRQRRYTQEDILLVKRMRQLSEHGLTLSEAADTALREARERNASQTPERAYELILERLAEYDERGATALWIAATEGRDVADSLERVAVPLLVRAGTLWEEGRLTIGAEHFISSFIRGRLEALYRSSAGSASNTPVLLACVTGERHELGLLMLAILLRFAGLPTTFLGADVPTGSIVESAQRLKAGVVVLYAAAAETAALVPSLAQRLATLSPSPAVVFGGQAFNEDSPAIAGALYGGSTLTAATRVISDIHTRSLRERSQS